MKLSATKKYSRFPRRNVKKKNPGQFSKLCKKTRRGLVLTRALLLIISNLRVQKRSFIWKSMGDPAPRISDIMENVLFHKQEGKLAEAGDRMHYLVHLIFF